MGGKDAASPRYVFTKLEVNQPIVSISNRPYDITSVLRRLERCSSYTELHNIKTLYDLISLLFLFRP